MRFRITIVLLALTCSALAGHTRAQPAVGQVMEALDEARIAENTLPIFSTDNGTSFADPGARQLRAQINHQLRDAKRSIYEGGHRVPYIVRWPGITPPGSTCHETIGLNDFMATAAEIAGVQLTDAMAVDSHSLLKLYQGGKREEIPPLIHHAFDGSYAVRKGPWKLVFPLNGETNTFMRALYHLENDLRETKNVLKAHPEKAVELEKLFEKLVRGGRSTPGPKDENFEDPEWMLPVAD